MKSSNALLTAAVLTALAACANPADGVAQTPQRQPAAERGRQAQKDDPDMTAAKQAADDAAAAAQAAADTMQEHMDPGYVPKPLPAYMPPTQEELNAVPNRMTSAQLRAAIVRMMNGLQLPSDLEPAALERTMGIRFFYFAHGADSNARTAHLPKSHSASIVIDGKSLVTINTYRPRNEDENHVTISSDHMNPACWLGMLPLLDDLEGIGYRKHLSGGPPSSFIRMRRISRNKEYEFGSSTLQMDRKTANGDSASCATIMTIDGWKHGVTDGQPAPRSVRTVSMINPVHPCATPRTSDGTSSASTGSYRTCGSSRRGLWCANVRSGWQFPSDRTAPSHASPTAEEPAAIPKRMTGAELQTAIARLPRQHARAG